MKNMNHIKLSQMKNSLGVSCERREGKKPSLLLAALKRGVEQEKDNSKEETILSCKIASFLISLRGPP